MSAPIIISEQVIHGFDRSSTLKEMNLPKFHTMQCEISLHFEILKTGGELSSKLTVSHPTQFWGYKCICRGCVDTCLLSKSCCVPGFGHAGFSEQEKEGTKQGRLVQASWYGDHTAFCLFMVWRFFLSWRLSNHRNDPPCLIGESAQKLFFFNLNYQKPILSTHMGVFLALLKFEIRASHLLVRHSTTWATPPVLESILKKSSYRS
jgi:hypothetical protein